MVIAWVLAGIAICVAFFAGVFCESGFQTKKETGSGGDEWKVSAFLMALAVGLYVIGAIIASLI